MSYYPALLNVTGRRCVVVGGGKVARRKVMTLVEYGASVTIISPELCPELEQLAGSGQVEAVRREYREGDLNGAFLALAATGDALVNQAAAREAGLRGVLIGVADDATVSDFIVPSTARIGDITLSVATAAQSPALARKIRMKLEKEIGKEYAVLLEIVGEVRRKMMRRGVGIDNEKWNRALDLDLLLELVRKGEKNKAVKALLEKLEDAD